MLGKVMKYELRAAGRQLLPFFGLTLALGVLLRVAWLLAGLISAPLQSGVESFVVLSGALAAVAIVFVAFIILIIRFYQSMVGSEAYLTFTLPVKVGTHIWGRALAGVVYTTLSLVVAIAVVLIAIPGAFGELMRGLTNPSVSVGNMGESRIVPLGGGTAVGLYILAVLLIVFFMLVTLYQFYASMAIGTTLTQNRVVGGVLGYMILNTVESVAALPFLIVPMALTIGFTEESWSAYFDRWMNGTDAEVLRQTMGFIAVILGIAVVTSLLFTAAHYIITKHYFGKKLNLE